MVRNLCRNYLCLGIVGEYPVDINHEDILLYSKVRANDLLPCIVGKVLGGIHLFDVVQKKFEVPEHLLVGCKNRDDLSL